MIGGAKGIGIGIDFGIPNQYCRATSKPYIEKDVLDSLRVVASAYGKSNDDADRSIVKNLVDASNPFIISNAAFKLNSGFGKYETELSDTRIWTKSKYVTSSPFSSSYNGLSGWIIFANTELTNSVDIPSIKIEVKGLLEGQELIYRYYDSTGQTNVYSMTKDGEYTLPADVRTAKTLTSNTSGFQIVKNETNTITITQIPSFQGAFVTDGIDDLIKSTKSATEMLDGSNEVTVVSMIHQIKTNDDTTRNNWFFTPVSYLENRVVKDKIGKTGIYGYTSTNVTNAQISDITPILGDKNDYTLYSKIEDGDRDYFTVEGFQNQGIWYVSSIAWYWTIIANKVLTTDQINQVIAYFNLDRTLNPDILCNTIKQGITNENHAEFGDKLIDFSGNGRDIQLNNIAWDGDSGIGKYNYPNWKVNVTQGNKYARIVYYDSINGTYSADFKGMTELYKSYGLSVEIRVNRANTIDFHSIKEDGIYTITPSDDTTSIEIRFGGENVYNASCDITITQIPSHAGALCLDGVNDFGQFVGDLGLKDYTLIMNRAYNNLINNQVPLVSSNIVEDQTPFIVEHWNTGSNAISFSYGASRTTDIPLDINKKIVYQSTYSYMGYVIPKGNAISTGGGITLGKFGNGVQYSAICLWSLMRFPYSMSEFLIERQLKKHKLGTLYPDMVEFRPVIKSNASYDNIVFYYKNEKVENGTYLTVGSSIGMHIHLSSSPVNEIKSITVNGIPATFKFHDANNNIYQYDFNLTSKSPQKIDITIDEYIRYEDIVQPYPLLFEFTDENGNLISWGGKAKVGNTISRTKSVSNANILAGLYKTSNYKLNGKALEGNSYVVEKSMIFTCTATYLLDNNEPKCILSPRRLRMPNSSYKILGYIPDISGHGNHGKINNSAYAEGSGVNEDGSYQFDGVDDFVTIPTIVGGKQVLMKVNWQNKTGLLYDQRKNGSSIDAFAILNVNSNNSIAYNSRNTDGETYIDGILNKNIVCPQLYKITHSITIINQLANKEEVISPTIGSDTTHKNYFSQMSLYDFMLFDDISTEDKIKELNEYVGIEAKVELPPYYWDAYGKTNLDADKATIQQRGVAVGDYDLTNTNFAYDKMSGFGGYEFEKFTDTTKWIETKREDGIEVIEKNDYSFTAKKVGTGQYFGDFKNNSIKTLDRDLTVKAISNNNVYIRWEFKYRTAEKPDIDSAIILLRQAMTPNVPITVTLPYKTQEEQTELGVVEGSAYYLFYFDPSDIPVGDEYTVEMLPLYTNGLVYDGITDYSKNANIPALDDFTAIIKREWLKKQGCPLIKGSKVYEGGNGNALLLEWDKAYNFVFYKRTDIMEGELPDNISFITPTNYNGNVITRGSEQDTNGICIAGDGNAGFANMVFYKLILYPKTIPLLQINFLKNLMERDEIIDLNNPIFIQE